MIRYLAFIICMPLLTATVSSLAFAADAGRCTGSKLKASATYSRCLLKLQARAATREQAVDTDKIAACDAKLSAAWQKAEDRGGSECPTLGDDDTVRDLFTCTSDNLSAALAGSQPMPSCSSNVTTTTTTTSSSVQECMNTGVIHQTSTTTSTVIPRCMNAILDGPETEVDCGGDCRGCETGQICNAGPDCLARVCVSGTCAAPTCADGVRNGFEIGVDCGGGPCPGCPAGAFCVDCSSCASMHCDSNDCQ